MTGSEATTKHKVTLDPICTPPAREESLMVRHGVLGWGAYAGGWVVYQYGTVGVLAGIMGTMLGRREHALDFLEVLDFIFALIYHRV